MFRMEKITTGIAYGASGGGTAAIGVLGSLMFGLLTWLTSLYFQIKADRRKAARGE